MSIKDSKAQIEVWEWKEALYEKTKNMTEDERIKYHIESTQAIVDMLEEMRKARDKEKGL